MCSPRLSRPPRLSPTVVAALAATFSIVLGDAIGSASPPNVLLIVADDLGFSDLGCYGGEIETPQLDRLAGDGVRLTRFYNTSRCCPSRASILTGHYPHQVGLGHMTQDLGQPGYRGRLDPDASTIAELLSPVGYRSFVAGKWHLGTEDPTEHGFEEFYGTLVSAKTFWDPDHFLRLPAGRSQRNHPANEFYGTDAVTDHALDFLELARQTPDRPWFLYLAYHAPHFPLHAPETEIAKYANRYGSGWDAIRQQRLEQLKRLRIVPESTRLTPRSQYWNYGETETGVNPPWETLPVDRRRDLARRMAIYAAMVDRMDQNIGRVIEQLREANELDQTLVMFLSDNGACAEWDPHGFDIKSSPDNILHGGDQLASMGGPGTFHSIGSGWANASNTPWRLYKHYVHEGGTNSPCILRFPSKLHQPGAIDHRPAHAIDLVPTMLSLAGVSIEDADPMPGRDLIAQICDPDAAARRLYFEHEGNRAVIDERWKLVALKGQPWELYDFSVERTELDDVAAGHPEVVERLSRLWDDWAAENQVTPLPDDYKVMYLKPTTGQ